MQSDDSLEFNFWASFADMMVALVLILTLLLFIVVAVISFNTVNLKKVEDNQKQIVNSIAANYDTEPKLLDNDEQLKRFIYGISTVRGAAPDIKVQNELNVQRISFSDKLLFRPDETEINQNGKEVLSAVGKILIPQLGLIKEISIEGHADTQKSGRYGTNTQLAAARAIAVFDFLQNDVGIDPNKKLMSVTSFGEYKSVKRGEHEETDYSADQLQQDNLEENLRSLNRRIEIVLIYKRKDLSDK